MRLALTPKGTLSELGAGPRVRLGPVIRASTGLPFLVTSGKTSKAVPNVFSGHGTHIERYQMGDDDWSDGRKQDPSGNCDPKVLPAGGSVWKDPSIEP